VTATESERSAFGWALALRMGAFFGIIAVLGWFTNIEPGRRLVVEPLTEAAVIASRVLINLFGGGAESQGTLLTSPTGVLDVKDGCNGVIAMILFAGAVLAHEASPLAKLLGLAIGLPAIWTVNLVRIVSLYIVQVVSPERLEFFHIYVWQTLIIICVAALWYVWAARSMGPVRKSQS
jgi:exosortase/archaeosortase family protein